ncbi:MAG: pantoate--beta-alanine ligase [Clostridiales bacterium]|nr:pantoate--beta-alanine ligase [Clostridiales bacterium]MDN5283607.1 pantoate--beta-alanine ligase [Candidatus Ozemobacter sp.]
MTEVVKSVSEWRKIRKNLSENDIGFVPTMGALHQGHISLLQRCKNDNRVTVASVFVNSTQFNDPEDFKKYPRDFERDLKMLRQAGVDYVFHPDHEEIYADEYRYMVSEKEFSTKLCGAYRPGHFDGVLTVVMKLFNIIRPARAYFGEKDYQQLILIRDMVSNFFMNIDIVGSSIIRESDGLAMSSRNQLLSAEERKKAPVFYKTLNSGKSVSEIINELEKSDFKVDYIEEHFGRIFGAVFLGKTRLIDNAPRN